MAAALEGLDAIVFCGGIGENASAVREAVLQPLHWIGVGLGSRPQSDARAGHFIRAARQ
jgi:acetate kinase